MAGRSIPNSLVRSYMGGLYAFGFALVLAGHVPMKDARYE
jgi:hypothetical protein